MVDPRALSAFSGPSQAMGNFISRELARRANKIPSPTPSIPPGLAKFSWPVASHAHTLSFNKWHASAPQAHRAPAPKVSLFQEWMLYRIRFISTDNIRCDWLQFGSPIPQINRLSIVPHLPAVEKMAVSLPYDRPDKEDPPGEKARARGKHSHPAREGSPIERQLFCLTCDSGGSTGGRYYSYGRR